MIGWKDPTFKFNKDHTDVLATFARFGWVPPSKLKEQRNELSTGRSASSITDRIETVSTNAALRTGTSGTQVRHSSNITTSDSGKSKRRSKSVSLA